MNLIDRVIATFKPEDIEQYAVVNYLEIKVITHGIKFTSIPNSTWTKSIMQRTRNTLLGLRPGLSDLLVVYPNHWAVFIEMKRRKEKGKPRGVVSAEQKKWVEVLNTIPNIEAHVCEGANEAIELLDGLLPTSTKSINNQNTTRSTAVSSPDDTLLF